jgi:5-deoxy-glucuronate isomerase
LEDSPRKRAQPLLLVQLEDATDETPAAVNAVVNARDRWHFRAGTRHSGAFALELTPQACDWAYASLRVLELPPGAAVHLDTGPEEMLVLPLTGACTVIVDGLDLTLNGRRDVFSRVTDFAYLPRDAAVVVRSNGGGRFALPGAQAGRRLPARYGPAEDVPVEIRGAGQASRQVNNFCSPEAFETDRLVSVEVLTPAGNWSSYPPHKHDERRLGEAVLEEIYYFEVGSGPSGPGVGYQRVYSSSASRPIDVLAEVGTGDVVVVPHGYHGPSMAAPGYDLYYLNVLAGPAAERSMAFCDDPSHAWIRASWAGQPVDPRLPMTSDKERQ